MKNEKGGPILPTPNPSQNSEQDWANFQALIIIIIISIIIIQIVSKLGPFFNNNNNIIIIITTKLGLKYNFF